MRGSCGDPGLAHQQALLLRRAVDRAGLSLRDVWMHYFSIGGNAGEMEVEAYLHQAFPLPELERDMLAHAVNELIDHRPVLYAPYSSEVVEAQEAGSRETGPTAGDVAGEEDGDADGDR